MTAAIGLQTHIWRNNRRSIMLLAFYPFVMLAMVWVIAAVFGYLWGANMNAAPEQAAQTALAMGNGIVAAYWPLVLTIIALWFLIAYFFNAKMIRVLSHARPVTRQEEPELYNLLENLCIAQGMTMPHLAIIETSARNAFASGIDEKSYSVTVTRGLLDALQKDELEAVLAHELTHIINRDVRLLIVSIIFTGMIGFIAQLAWSSFRYSLYTRAGGGRRDGRVMLMILIVMVVLWLGYLATIFTRFALSRHREFMADAGAIEMTKNPDAMMRALLQIAANDRIPETTDDVALMCTASSHKFMGLFATHPPIEARVKAIADVTGTPVPEIIPEITEARPPDASRTNPWDQ